MTPQEKADAEASAAGISPLAELRELAIAQRGAALWSGNMHGAVTWSHMIWWLSKTQELLAESDQT